VASDILYPFAVATREHALASDIGGVTSIDYALSTVSGRQALAEAILRRLTTRRGGLFYAPSYGYAIVEIIGSSVSASEIEQRVVEQCLLEEEVEDATCTATFTDAGGTRSVAIDIKATDAKGPFDLTLNASELTISALLEGTELFNEVL